MPLACSSLEMKGEPAHSISVRHFCIIGPSSRARSPASRQSARTQNEQIAMGLKKRQEAALAGLGFRERQTLSTITKTGALHASGLGE